MNTTTYSVLQTISTGAGPVEIAVATDDSLALVTNFDGQSFTSFDLITYTPSTFSLPGSPLGLVLTN